MNKRILIIDDNEDILEMLGIIFQDSDVDVVLSRTGMTGDEIKVIHPDIVLLDVQINGYSYTGDEICKEIKSHPVISHIPVFLISAEDDLAGISMGCAADGWFSKPFDVWKLKEAIKMTC
jgi:two-component system, OmpR family, response regulator VicR